MPHCLTGKRDVTRTSEREHLISGNDGSLLYNADLGPLAQLVRAEDSSVNGVVCGEPCNENRVNSGKPKAGLFAMVTLSQAGDASPEGAETQRRVEPLNHRHERPTP
jgi:hypothetical protein